MAVKSTILVLLTTVVVMVSSAGFLGEQHQLRSRGNLPSDFLYDRSRFARDSFFT